MDMKKNVVGIIAEYNPLHNGHAYHLATAREKSAADAVVVALSSHFVQRGEPAFLDKWQRTRMALSCGADLVLELPCLFSCANAGIFANAGVDILAHTGIVTHLSFGMENPSSGLDMIAAILVQEPPLFKAKLRFFLDAGYSFVEARSRAVETLLPQQGKDFLGGANNSLAVAYACRVLAKQYDLVLVPVLRKGKGYHDPTPDALASATALREMARSNDREALRRAMPTPSATLLLQSLDEGRTTADRTALWRILRSLLLRSGTEEIASSAELREGLEHRILEAARYSTSWEELVNACITKRYPRGRIQRHLMHILLGLDHWEYKAIQRLGPAYIRVLGANQTGRVLLRRMRDFASLPVLSRASAPDTVYARRIMNFEHRAAEIWENLLPNPRIKTEATSRPILS
jgi:predicted nucleotidyltransferase